MGFGALNKVPLFATPAGQAFRLAKASTTVHYYGHAPAGSLETDAIWQIQKATIDEEGDIVSIEYPKTGTKASSNFAYVWEDRASYTYE